MLGKECPIYNSRNYYRLLNTAGGTNVRFIYNSRNYYRLLNSGKTTEAIISTTVEITIGYLTRYHLHRTAFIYNSRNYYRLLNGMGNSAKGANLQQ